MNFRKLIPCLSTLGKSASTHRIAVAGLAVGVVLSAAPTLTRAQTAPPYLVTTPTTLPTPAGFGGPNGNLAADKFGNVYVPDAAQSQVLEYPANGGPAIVIFDATKTAPQVSGVAVDSANNLYVTTRYDSSVSTTESDIFKFPYTSSGYPGAYVYTGAAPPLCSPTSTNVCAYGNFLQTTGYYYQPQSIGFDAAGNGYMITTYDSLNKAGGLTIYACDVQCGYDIDGATIAIVKLPTAATSLAVAPNGDLYWADGTDVYFSAAGSGKATLFDKSYESQYGGAAGVAFDRAGNLYVTNSGGTYEVPLTGGLIKAANKFQVAISTVGGYAGAAIDNNGNVYSAAYSTLLKSSLFNYNFGQLALGSASATQTFTVTFLSAGTITSLVAQQAGVPSTEFTFSQGTCLPGAFTAGSTCTFTVSFTPAAVGIRRATVTLTDFNGNQTNTYLTGSGLGTGVAVDPGTPTAISSTLKTPSGLSIDAAGNLFVADATAPAVYEYIGGTGTPITIGSGFKKPTGVATDGGGNLYVVDQSTGTLSLLTNTAGKFSTTGTGTAIATGLNAPTDVVVSGSGAVYVSNTGANTILQYPNASRIGSLTESLSLGVGLSGPTGLALDPSGNLYIADTGNNRTVQLGYSGAQTPFGTGLNAPTGVAAEPSGSVLIADQGNGRIVRVPNEAGTLTTADQVTLSQPLVNPYSIRLASSGNLYVSDNQAGAVDVLQRTAGTLNFGISNVNTPSSTQTVVVSSTGTADLTLTSPFFSAPPANSNFTLTTGTGTVGCTAGTLATGRDCTLNSVFTPTSVGVKTYTAPLNTTATNATMPSITLMGTGVQLVGVNVTLTKTSPTGTVTFGVPVVLTVTVASSSSSTTSVPTGTVTFNVDGSNSKPVALVNGSASITLNGLGGNTSHNVTATYNGGAVYGSGSSTPFTFTVQPATLSAVLTIFADDELPLSSVPGDAVSFSVAITPSIVVSAGLSGAVNFVSGGIVIGTGTIQQSNSGAYSAGFSTTALLPSCLTGQTLPNCSNIYQIQAVFAGNGNYSGFTTAAQAVVITPPTYTVVASNTTITSTAAQYGTATLTVTSYSNFTGGVALSCSGLPANAYCIFRPGLISLTSVVTTPATPTTPGVSTIPIQTTTMEIRVDQNPTNIQSAASFGLLGLVCAVAIFLIKFRREGTRGLLLCCLIGLLGSMSMASLSGCGSTSSSNAYPTPAGTYPIVLTATASPIASNGQPPNVENVTAISATAGTVTVDLSGQTLLSSGATILVTGVTPSTFNGTFATTNLKSIPSTTLINGQPAFYYDEFTYSLPTGVTATGSGGTVRAANLSTTKTFSLIVQ